MLKLALGLLAILFIIGFAAAQTHQPNAEWELLSLLNNARNANGKGYISPSVGLRDVARRWAKELARTDRVAHNPNLSGDVSAAAPGWNLVGENVVKHVTVQQMHDMWWNSQGHRTNMLRDYNNVGIGVYKQGQYLYGVTVFTRGGNNQLACCGVAGSIASKYNSGWQSALGSPTTNELITPDGTGLPKRLHLLDFSNWSSHHPWPHQEQVV